jgi:peptidoglycan-associated lipoprotein
MPTRLHSFLPPFSARSQNTFKRTAYSLMLASSTAILLSACASKVKLDDAPTTGTSGVVTVPSTTGSSNGAGSSESRVSTVAADNTASQTGMANLPATIYFDYDSYLVRPDAMPTVEGYAKRMQATPAQRLMLEGHTDERGGREYNLALGQKRAEAVVRALTLLGVADDKLEAVSMGEEQAAVAGEDEAAWSQNRRVEFKAR